MDKYDSPELINVGCGEDITVRELADLVGRVVGFPGKIEWDINKPDGTPRKLLDVTKLSQLGWKARTPLEAGLRATYQWWLEHGRG
jgi:GDP-L-fucose synthase